MKVTRNCAGTTNVTIVCEVIESKVNTTLRSHEIDVPNNLKSNTLPSISSKFGAKSKNFRARFNEYLAF